MGIEVQFNSSTLKASYNTSTDKIQVTEFACSTALYTNERDCLTCFDAGETPLQVMATVTGLFNCNDTLSSFNGEHCLTKFDPVNPPDANCQWTKGLGGDILIGYSGDLFDIQIFDTSLKEEWFRATPAGNCQLQFVNDYVKGDCGGDVVGYGGTIRIRFS